MQSSFTMYTLALYITTSLACILFAICQRRTHRVKEDETNTLSDYALLVSGMPIEQARDDIEGKYTELFRKSWGPRVLGVSICWDHGGEHDHIAGMAMSAMAQYDREFDGQFLNEEDREMLKEEEEEAADVKRIIEDLEEDRGFCDPEMRWVDNIFWGQPIIPDKGRAEEKKTEDMFDDEMAVMKSMHESVAKSSTDPSKP